MIQPPNPDLWDSDGNLLVPRYGIQIAMRLALLAASAFWLFLFLAEREVHRLSPEMRGGSFPDSLGRTLLWVALPLVPFLFSGLLLSARSEEAIAAGAGVAAALFLIGLLFSIAAILSLVVGFHPSYPVHYGEFMAISSLILSGCSVWIVVSAFRIANKAGWGVFFLAVVATLVVMTWAYHSLGGH